MASDRAGLAGVEIEMGAWWDGLTWVGRLLFFLTEELREKEGVAEGM